jgi:S-adenosylmethionine:tRNA ribosyltransferase-isomerase
MSWNQVKTSDFNYELPKDLIAQVPAEQRDESRLLVLNRAARQMAHHCFRDLPSLLRPGDILVVNNSRVISARLHGIKTATGARFEILMLEENRTNDWWVMLKPGKRAAHGTRIQLLDRTGQDAGLSVTVIDKSKEGYYRVLFEIPQNILDRLNALGGVPLPPYISRPLRSTLALDRERYQTVYAEPPGSVAAPTAGLHFTPSLLRVLRDQGVRIHPVTLHVGAGTFAPVKAEQVEDHRMHEERYELPEETAEAIEVGRRERRRIIAVGTTTVRVLESVALTNQGRLVPGAGRTRIFICPPYRFQVVDGLITNFHLPQSTLLMLVCAFASPGEVTGRPWMLGVYEEAIRLRYRFFSYGDAMLLV